MSTCEQLFKKQKTDAKQTKANEVIDLYFVEDNHSTAFPVQPQFTHQLFKDETLVKLTTSDEAYSINVKIDCKDLSQTLNYSNNVSAIDQDMLFNHMKSALPSDVIITPNEYVSEYIQSQSPPGRLVHSFSVSGQHFEVYLVTALDGNASVLLSRAEKIAMWFIETADSVDFSDKRWEALFIFRRNDVNDSVDNTTANASSINTDTLIDTDTSQSFTFTAANNTTTTTTTTTTSSDGITQYYFIGYMTLFTFHNPIFGSKLRVCQALIFPTYQGKGVGKEVLLSLYRMLEHRQDITELTVEDPCVGFQRMRDSVDFEWYARHYLLPPRGGDNSNSNGGNGDSDSSIDTEEKIAKKLKITKLQSAFLLEVQQYIRMLKQYNITNNITTNTTTCTAMETTLEFKEFRLKVKRRLIKVDPELKSMSKSDMQSALGELFNEEMSRYKSVLKTAITLGIL